MKLDWQNTREIGENLYDLDQETHPLSIRFTDLHSKIMALEGFVGSPDKSSEGLLEAIQMVWYEEWQEDNDSANDPYLFK